MSGMSRMSGWEKEGRKKEMGTKGGKKEVVGKKGGGTEEGGTKDGVWEMAGWDTMVVSGSQDKTIRVWGGYDGGGHRGGHGGGHGGGDGGGGMVVTCDGRRRWKGMMGLLWLWR